MNNLSIIIPSKTRSNLEACLKSVYQAEPTSKVIVVDDGIKWPHNWQTMVPDNGSLWCVKGATPFVFARNVNIGMKAADDDEDVILLNDDALLQTANGFTAMQRAAYDHPEYGIIGAVTNVTGQMLQKPQNVGLRQVPHIAFVCVLIPFRTIKQIGYLDERYCLDYGVEDRDYCEAVNRAGLKVGVYDHCFVDHASLQSSFRGDPHAGRTFHQNYALFKEKWGIQE